jgi:hypothetical protein
MHGMHAQTIAGEERLECNDSNPGLEGADPLDQLMDLIGRNIILTRGERETFQTFVQGHPQRDTLLEFAPSERGGSDS